MSSRVKGIIVEIGGDTTGLDKALKDTNKQIGTTQSSLKDVQRLLKLDPTNTNLLEQKQRLLAKAAEETASKLEALEDANKQVAETAKNYDAWKAAYNPIQKEITETSNKLADLKKKQKELEDVGETNSNTYEKITNEVHSTAKALQALRKQAKQVKDEFGNPISPEQYDRLQREIEATKIDFKKLEDEAQDTASKLKKIDEGSIEDVADAANKAEDALADASKQASNFGDMLKAELSADGLEAMADTLKDVAEESKEYRKVMASLEVSSKDAGYSAEETAETYKKLYGVLGDEQTAATTVANLQALRTNQSSLKTIINGTVGAWAKYGDSIPIDGLAEAINETVKTGQVTGNLADVLNWGSKAGETFGVTMRANTEANQEWNDSVADAKSAEDFFNLALQQCSTEAERTNLIMQMMADQGLTSAGEAWQRNNQSLIESNQAQANLQEQTANLGELVEPVFTRITNAVATALAWFNSLDSGTQTFILTIFGLIAAVATLAPVVSGAMTLFNGLNAVLGFLAANPIVLIIAAIAALIAAFALLWNKCEGFRNFWIGLWEGIKSMAVSAWTFLQENVFQPIANAFVSLWNGIKSVLNGMFRGIEAYINGIVSGVNFLIRAVNKISFDVPDWVPAIGGKKFGFNIPELSNVSLPQLAEGGSVLRGSAIVGEAGPELLTVQPGRTLVQPLNSSTTTNNHSTNLGSVAVNVYGAPGQDVRQLAQLVMEEFQTIYTSREAALV